MKIIADGKNILVGRARVDISINTITRQFTISNKESEQSLFIGQDVEIFNDQGNLLIKGEIEYFSVNGYTFEYAGRNAAKYIVDCHSDKTIQFSESQDVQAVLEEVAGKFGLEVIGTARMPENSSQTILIGELLGEAFIKVAKSTGQIITSDATGNIVLLPEPAASTLELVYGENIRERTYVHNTTQEYDRYLVVCQSFEEPEIMGEYGSGDFVKVMVMEDDLTEVECENLAKNEFFKDRRKSVIYAAEVDETLNLDVNVTHKITDKVSGIASVMNVKELIYTMDSKESKITAKFENKGSI